MNFLVKIWIFNFNFTALMSFVAGLIAGATIMSLVFGLIIISSIGHKKYIVKTENDSLTEIEAKEMIYKAQRAFKDKELRGDLSKFEHLRNIGYDMVYGIAKSFFPNSKYPLLELSVDETIALIGYVQKRVDEIFDGKVIRRFRGIRIAFIYGVTRNSQQIKDSTAFKGVKKASDATKKINKVLNTINPINLFRKAVTSKVTNSIVTKIYCVILGVVGEEAYKIYSKKALNKELEIDTDVESIVKSIKEDIDEYDKNEKEIIENRIDEIINTNIDFKKNIYSVKGNNNYKSIQSDEFDYKKNVEVQNV